MSRKTNLLQRICSLVICFVLMLQQTGFSQVAGSTSLTTSGQVDISQDIGSGRACSPRLDTFRPAHLRYFSYNSQDNSFKVLVDKGDFLTENRKQRTENRKDKDVVAELARPDKRIQQEAKKLLQYFLTGVSLEDESFWVNLRPDSEDQITDSWLAKTDVGKIMLEADLQLKKDTALFTSPQTKEGREYWDKLYKKAEELFGTETVDIPTLTRPWIVPGEIIIRETNDDGSLKIEAGKKVIPSAYIYKASLKVMLEEDYLKKDETTQGVSLRGATAAKQSQTARIASPRRNVGARNDTPDPRLKQLNTYSTQLIKELIIPKLTKEINSSKRYAALRQVYYSLILARWFKQRFSGSRNHNGQGNPAPTGSDYAHLINSRNLTGLTSTTPWSKETYFKQYQKSFAEGEYNIKEPVATPTGQVIRSYFSGGIKITPEQTWTGFTGGLEDKNFYATNPNLMPIQGKDIIDVVPRYPEERSNEGSHAAGSAIVNKEAIAKEILENKNIRKALTFAVDRIFYSVVRVVLKEYYPYIYVDEWDDDKIEDVKAYFSALITLEYFESFIDKVKEFLESDGLRVIIRARIGQMGTVPSNLFQLEDVFRLREVDLIPEDRDKIRALQDELTEALVFFMQAHTDALLKQAIEWQDRWGFMTKILPFNIKSGFKGKTMERYINLAVRELVWKRKNMQIPEGPTSSAITVDDVLRGVQSDFEFNGHTLYELGRTAIEGYLRDEKTLSEAIELLVKSQGEQQVSRVRATAILVAAKQTVKHSLYGLARSAIEEHLLGLDIPVIAYITMSDPEITEAKAKKIVQEADKMAKAGSPITNTKLVEIIYAVQTKLEQEAHEFWRDNLAGQDASRPSMELLASLNQFYREKKIIEAIETDFTNTAMSKESFASIGAFLQQVPAYSQMDLASQADLTERFITAYEELTDRASSGVKAQKKENASLLPAKPGGIDFRSIVTRPLIASSSLNLKLPQSANLAEIDLDAELQQFHNMLKAGIAPSGERIKEFIASSAVKGEWDKRVANIIPCLVDICRLDEENLRETPLEIKEALIIADLPFQTG